MSDLNNVTLVGRLTFDPEIKPTASILICECSIANNDSKNNANFIKIKSFGNTAEKMNSLKKGDRIGVVGRIVQDKWVDQEGKNKSKLSVIGNIITVLDKVAVNTSSNVSEG